MEIKGQIQKVDSERRIIFGWANVAVDENNRVVVDSDNDTIPIEELEQAAYRYVEFSGYGGGGEMHQNVGVANLIESMVFTPEKSELLGISGTPQGWWVGFRVTDDNVWQKVKSGEYSMFSIGGRAVRREIA